MLKRIYMLFCLMATVSTAIAEMPPGYYDSADGKKFTELKAALCQVIKEHKTFNYSSLWNYYPYTYYVLGNPTQVLDMYSDNVVYFSNTSTMNKEHTVPKSWWGGSTSIGPGCDIFNVIPSDQVANSNKSNYPLGIVAGNAKYDNGVTKVGTSGVGGYTGLVFEPKDSYKGDFARIYFYVATCYPDLSWDSNNAQALTNSSALTLKSWIIPMLIEWNSKDPVDEAEIQRNEDVYKQQGNRNPFIDYPALVDYIWGSKQTETFLFAEHEPNGGNETQFQAQAPSFSVDYGTETKPKYVAENTSVTISGGTKTATLYTRINGGQWEVSNPTTGWNSTSQTEYTIEASKTYSIEGKMLIEAYCTQEGYTNSKTVSAYYEVMNFSNEYILFEAFDNLTAGNNTSNSGSSTYWDGNDNFPVVETAFQAGNAVRLGSSKTAGSLQSKALPTAGGSLIVEFEVKGWTAVEGDIVVELTGAGSQTVQYTATMTDSFEKIKLQFDNVSANPILTIGTSAKRAFIDSITVKTIADGINLTTHQPQQAVDMFNLSGQKVGKDYKGITIIKGKNVMQ